MAINPALFATAGTEGDDETEDDGSEGEKSKARAGDPTPEAGDGASSYVKDAGK